MGTHRQFSLSLYGKEHLEQHIFVCVPQKNKKSQHTKKENSQLLTIMLFHDFPAWNVEDIQQIVQAALFQTFKLDRDQNCLHFHCLEKSNKCNIAIKILTYEFGTT